MSAPRDVVFFSIFDWWTHGHGYGDFQLALELSRDRRVLFVNSVGMRAPTPGRTERVWRRVWRKARSAFRGLVRPRPDLPNFWVVTLATLPVYEGGAARLANMAAAAQVRLAMRRCGIAEANCIVSVPTAFPIARRIGAGAIVYRRADDHGSFPEAGDAVRALEAEMLSSCPLVLYSAAHLKRREESVVGDRGVYLEHGVDLARFHPGVPPDPIIAGLPGPRIGFFGMLRAHDLDVILLQRLADEIPEVSLVLVGDRNDRLDDLIARRNVRWFPQRPHAEIPACWAALDVGLAPYETEGWGWAVEPVKLREMLAMGLPVVATAIPAAVSRADVVVADSHEAFVALVRKAIEAGPRRSPADLKTWAYQGARLAALLEEPGLAARGNAAAFASR
jgi:glycosyltransferase involved in cell wall biosynthesis